MNSKTKAVNIGLDKGQPAEAEGWGEGQPLVRIMTREVRVMKRWGYEWQDGDDWASGAVKHETDAVEEAREPALWGVDLEALRKANNASSGSSNLPIYPAQSARSYLMKAFETPSADAIKKDEIDVKVEGEAGPKLKGKRTAAVIAAEKERNLGLLLGALELLYKSWSAVLSNEDLDKRAWGWYVRVRPEVAQGAAGWGGKGSVKMADILALRRPSG
jgi:hypothetical protein